MEPHLRRYIASSLMIAVLASGALAAGGVTLTAYAVVQRIIANASELAFAEAQNRFEMLDMIVWRAERDAMAAGEAALLKLAERFPALASAEAIGSAALKATALELGVDEVYFVDERGVVKATSFEPDLGLRLFELGEPFRLFLEGVLGSGRVEFQRMSMSTMTAQANSYQYYGPVGADYIAETSTRMARAVPAAFPGGSFSEILKLVLNTDGPGDAALVKAVDLIGGRDGVYRSYIEERFTSDEITALANRAAESGGYAERRDGDTAVIIKALSLSKLDFSYVDDWTYAVFEADYSLTTRLGLGSIVVTIALISAAIVASYFLSRRLFEKHVTSRLEDLAESMSRISAGNACAALDDGRGDEISMIGKSAESMVSQILERNETLSKALEANQALVHEMNHRVNNNLQLAVSLVSMQIEAGCSDDAKRALERMRDRLGLMSLVHDQALKEPERPRVDMGGFLSDIVSYIAGGSGPRTARVHRAVEADGLEFPVDRAFTVGLIASELIDNAYRHAFARRETGTLSVRLGLTAEGDLALVVADDGDGAPKPGGVGLELAGALASQLGGRLSWESGRGSRVTVAMPAAD